MAKSSKKFFKKRKPSHYGNSRLELPNKPEMVEFKGSIKKWLKEISDTKVGYLKKDKGRTYMALWWETNERHFMNMAMRKDVGKPCPWVIAKDVESQVKYYCEKFEYKLCIDK